MRYFALVTAQGTACSETVLNEDEYADPEMRARAEAQARLVEVVLGMAGFVLGHVGPATGDRPIGHRRIAESRNERNRS